MYKFNIFTGKFDYYEQGSGTFYTLPIASAGTLGGIKVGTRLSIDGNGVLSADVQAGGGDMLAATYDPTNVAGDAFSYANMVANATVDFGAYGLLVGADITLLKELGHQIIVDNSTTADTGGGALTFTAGNGFGAALGGSFILNAGVGGATGGGGNLTFNGGGGGATSGNGGSFNLIGGDAGADGNGGDVLFQAGAGGGAGINGKFIFTPAGGNLVNGILDFDSLDTSDRTFTFPNATGTIALTSDLAGFLTTVAFADLSDYPADAAGFLSNNGAGVLSWQAAGAGDMILASEQAVTGLKTFDTTKLAVKGSSTGTTAIASANASATGYTQTLQARDGTVANLDNVTYIGTTSVALNRASAALTLAGITLTTPDIGTPSAGNLSNCTALPASSLTSATLAGSINLGEGADPATIGLVVDNSLSADERYSGITVAGTAGATISFGDLCYLDVTATEWLLADASAAATAGDVVLGICVDASTDGNATSMLLIGTVRSAAFPASIALGAPVYISETAGDITSTQPTTTDAVIRKVGFAVTAEPNTIWFSPSNDFITHT